MLLTGHRGLAWLGKSLVHAKHPDTRAHFLSEQMCFFIYFFTPKAVLQRGLLFQSSWNLFALCLIISSGPELLYYIQRGLKLSAKNKNKKNCSTWGIRSEEFNLLNCDKVWLGRLQLFTQEVNISELWGGQEEGKACLVILSSCRKKKERRKGRIKDERW